MTNIGEAVSVLMGGPAKDECPFCTSEKKDPEPEDMEIVNDSAILARNSGGMPSKQTVNPDADEDYDIHNKYWVSQKKSRIALNAHHLIPGNASLAPCAQIRKWMSGKNVVKKKFHDSAIEAEVAQVADGKKAAERAKLVAKKHKTYVLHGPTDAVVTFSTAGKAKSIHRDNTVDEQHVTGKIDYDQNSKRNNAWLPSNNAIAGWGSVKSVNSEDQDGNADSFDLCYAYNTMLATGWQFHDAHPSYSDAVLNRLGKLEVKVKKLSDDCIDHEKSQANENEGKPFPAPKRLAGALYQLASCFKRELSIRKKPKAPWLTSKLSDQW